MRYYDLLVTLRWCAAQVQELTQELAEKAASSHPAAELMDGSDSSL